MVLGLVISTLGIKDQNRVNELKASPDDGKKNINSKRVEFMLDTICDIKNNKRRKEEDPAPHTRIKKWLQKEVIDTSGGCGASFVVDIVSEQFEGKRLLERHRLLNAALEEEMKEIHALSIKKAITPEQWKQQQESVEPKSEA